MRDATRDTNTRSTTTTAKQAAQIKVGDYVAGKKSRSFGFKVTAIEDVVNTKGRRDVQLTGLTRNGMKVSAYASEMNLLAIEQVYNPY